MSTAGHKAQTCKVQKVLCERWIVIDERGIRRSTWYQTPQEAEKEQDRLEQLSELPVPD
jgi:hypothetical protein